MTGFDRISGYPKGTLYSLLRDAYSFDPRCAEHWADSWAEFDGFFYDNPNIADRCGFITEWDGEAVGFASWDPRGLPERVVVGHNCVASAFKGRGIGISQMKEAVLRISHENPAKITVTTSGILTAAQKMYADAGFKLLGHRENDGPDAFSGDYIDYELVFSGKSQKT